MNTRKNKKDRKEGRKNTYMFRERILTSAEDSVEFRY